jgi:hypothetical protein
MVAEVLIMTLLAPIVVLLISVFSGSFALFFAALSILSLTVGSVACIVYVRHDRRRQPRRGPHPT